ncbi:MAG: hypothetical protein AAB766_03150 [Patescibacteria group bacterium]
MPSHEKPETTIETEQPFSFEHWLDVELQKQYIKIAKALNEVGLLEIIPDTDEKGIRGIDGNVYPIPTIETIKAELMKNREIYELKMKQGFTKINLVPIALPIAKLIDVYRIQLLDHFKRKKLFYPPKNPNDKPEPITEEGFNDKNPFHIAEEYKATTINKSLKYYPGSFGYNNGVYKKELLAELEKTPFSGWIIELFEGHSSIPRRGKGKTKGGRKQIEAGRSATGYFAQLLLPEYRHETGQTIESVLAQAITNLHINNQVLDTVGTESGCINLLFGNLNPLGEQFPYFDWGRDDHHAYIDQTDNSYSSEFLGFRPIVLVGHC